MRMSISHNAGYRTLSFIKIKICGLTRSEDIKTVVAAGVDAIGFVFTASPRQVTARQAVELCRDVPGHTMRIGLFLDQGVDEIEQVINTVNLDVIQFHGQESRQLCERFGMPYLKAVSMTDKDSLTRAETEHPNAIGFLLDSHEAGKPGGSGHVFDWSVSTKTHKPVWLAGGLNANNVVAAIKAVRPYAVDVSSGVEARPGIKDKKRIHAFVTAVKQFENT